MRAHRQYFWAAACLLLAFIPLANMTVILATTGVDTPSNDYLMFVQLADRFLSGQQDWRLYFQDTLYTRVHSYAFLFPIRLLLLRLSDLSIYAEIYAGLLLAVARLLLFYRLLTFFLPAPPGQPWYRSPYLWLLPGLSALVFANAQITTFSYGETILQFGLTQLFLLLGLLLLLDRSQPARNVWLAALCGLLASYSGGSGLAAWPVFLLAILWGQRRRPAAYTAWLAGLLLSAWPYLAYSAYASQGSFQNVQLQPLLIGLGLPFANHINYGLQEHSQAQITGLLGLVLAACSLGLLAKRKPCVFSFQAVPALLLMSWGLVYAVQVMLSRKLIAPWYTTSYSLFWLGLLGLLPLFLARLPHRPWRDWQVVVLPAWGLGLLVLLGVLYGRTNLTYIDKSFYLAARAPASAACLRHYLNAPTYCEGLVFQWNQGTPAALVQLGQPLARHQLSVLAADQEWTLQGDYVLGTVQWAPFNAQQPGGWVRGAQDLPAHWSDYHHLNALLPAGQSIRWQFDLPPGLHAARFATGLSLPHGAACAPGSAFTVQLEDARGASHLLLGPLGLCALDGWQALEVDLSPYAGQRVTLVMAAGQDWEAAGFAKDNGAAAPAARLRYPRLHLSGVPRDSEWQAPARPSNTDLWPGQTPVAASAYRLPVSAAHGWQFDQLTPSGVAGRYRKNGSVGTAWYALEEGGLCLTDWSQFYVQAALPDSYPRKLVQVRFAYRPADGQPALTDFSLPLLAGEELHTYTINLDLLKAPPSACITGVHLFFLYDFPLDASNWIDLKEAGFLARADQ